MRSTPDSTTSADEYQAPALVAEGFVVFPHTEVTITIRDARNIAALTQALKERQLAVFVGSSNSADAVGSVGTLILVRRVVPSQGGGMRPLLKGLWRVYIKKIFEERERLRVSFVKAGESDDTITDKQVMRAVLNQIDEFVKIIPGISPELIEVLKSARTPGELADLCAYSPEFSFEEQLDLLRTLDAERRLRKISRLFETQLNALRKAASVRTIGECETCIALADRAFESEPNQRGEIALAFLNHVVHKHTGELMAILAERYGSIFMSRRALR